MKIKIILLITLSVLFLDQTDAQEEKTFYLGHSLVNFQIPQMVSELAKHAGKSMIHKEHIGIGANLAWNWTKPQSGQGDLWPNALTSQTFDNFVITEAVPLKNHLQWSNTYAYLDSFYRYATIKSPNIRLYIYETWHCINSGTPTGCEWDNDKYINWRQRLDIDKALWEGIADSHNNRYPADAYIIPGGQGLAKLHDQVYAGNVSGVSDHRHFFSDDIHLTSIGNYFIACIMYAVLFEKSPEGLPHQLRDQYGQNYQPAPDQAMALTLQKIAWQTVCEYSRTNVNCQLSNTVEFGQTPGLTFIFPFIINENNMSVDLEIYNVQGQRVKHLKLHDKADISDLDTGMYFVKTPSDFKTIKIFLP